MNKRRSILIAIPLCLVCIIVFVAMQQNKHDVMLPDEVTALIQNYMDAYKHGTTESAKYIHFEDEFTRAAYIATGNKMIDYKIESTEKINDNLYGLVVLIKTENSIFYSGDVYERVYNFVARIADEWYYINGVSNIPGGLRENLNESKYTYNDENIVDPGDIVNIIEMEGSGDTAIDA